MMTSLIATGVVAVISAVFAALISITDSIVNNYGDCVVNINGGKQEITVKGGDNVLVTMSEKEIYIPSACGGRGTCGECSVKVVSDVGPHLPTELPHLSPDQIKDNVRLACQIKIRGDLSIEVPEYLFSVKQYEGVVEKISEVTHDIKEVYIKLPEEIDFVSGQYGQIEVPPYGKIREQTQRAYSMSSRPNDKNHVEFLVRLVPDGIVTTYVHQRLKEGQKLKVIGPFGEFYVRDTGATMVCVAGGSGMAPFKSIFNDFIDNNQMDSRDIWYFFGAVKSRDMYYLDWLRELEQKYKRFHFIPALSDPDPGTEWDGPVGLVTEVLSDYLRDKIPTDQPREGYLCGSPGMLDACMDVMRKHNMTDDAIYFDKFS